MPLVGNVNECLHVDAQLVMSGFPGTPMVVDVDTFGSCSLLMVEVDKSGKCLRFICNITKIGVPIKLSYGPCFGCWTS